MSARVDAPAARHGSLTFSMDRNSHPEEILYNQQETVVPPAGTNAPPRLLEEWFDGVSTRPRIVRASYPGRGSDNPGKKTFNRFASFAALAVLWPIAGTRFGLASIENASE